MLSGALRLAPRWTLAAPPRLSRALVGEFILPVVRAVPASMARRLGHCRISLDIAHATVASQWTETEAGLEVSVITAESEDHDIAMELLLCLGQALWAELVADGLVTVFLESALGHGQDVFFAAANTP